MVNDAKGRASTTTALLSLVAAIDLLIAGGVFLVVAVVAPDEGITANSLRQGVVLASVFAAAPIAALARGADSASLVALGGGMMVAGAATMPGGNLLGPVMVFAGVILLLVGSSTRPKLTAGIMGRLLAYAISLGLAVWLALGTMALSGIVSLVLALAVATSTRWGMVRA
jgi:hypothetical protein